MGKNDESPFMHLLKDKGKTPEDVASALNVKVRAVYFWLAGERTPRFTIEQVQKLCSLLDCSVHQLPRDFSRNGEIESA
jgi:transcriptional regulator with XRE-family HTH domain